MRSAWLLGVLVFSVSSLAVAQEAEIDFSQPVQTPFGTFDLWEDDTSPWQEIRRLQSRIRALEHRLEEAERENVYLRRELYSLRQTQFDSRNCAEPVDREGETRLMPRTSATQDAEQSTLDEADDLQAIRQTYRQTLVQMQRDNARLQQEIEACARTEDQAGESPEEGQAMLQEIALLQSENRELLKQLAAAERALMRAMSKQAQDAGAQSEALLETASAEQETLEPAENLMSEDETKNTKQAPSPADSATSVTHALATANSIAVFDIDNTVLPLGESRVLGGVDFEKNSAALKPDALAALDVLVEVLQTNPGYALTISGHTDARGDAARNQALSQWRAKAVGDYLLSHGIAAARVSTLGEGAEKPLASNDTEAGRALNRRVEVKRLL